MWPSDVSQNRTRRWCSMVVCGNRAKAAGQLLVEAACLRSRRGSTCLRKRPVCSKVGLSSASRCRLAGDVETGLTKKVEIHGKEGAVRIWPNSLEELRGEVRLHL